MIECKKEKIEVVGRDSEAPGLIKVRIPLNKRPEGAWRDYFLNSPLKWTSVHKPDIEGSKII
ncbi:hypothetical protein AKJ36_01245 [candidate division MSBL1 archaeon SCGC-AAA259I07]|uniref:Uncharacterized protein n=1 Tax=candidate division MSBL1 archaeon SCGC-AAA259I07 TaxID=1698266 RepID=A0A133UM85_9EURY|nr:hypothetical protein AKJ36_01245 [candidate division MSBL1 archaeon SCGC-AAA259I07]